MAEAGRRGMGPRGRRPEAKAEGGNDMTVLAAIVGLLLLAGLWLRDKAAEERWKADDARFAELEGKLRAEEA